MAILGGVGNPVGGSFTGSGSSFEVIGNHIYALNNGTSAGQNVEFTLLDATTGNYYTVGKLRFVINSSSGDDFQFKIYFNGSVVYADYATSATGSIHDWPLDLIIPSYTEVKFTAANASSGDPRQVFIDYVGRIYRAGEATNVRGL